MVSGFRIIRRKIWCLLSVNGKKLLVNFNILLFIIHLGVPEYLSTEICTAKQKQFPLITFLDTPGLVDGDMKYPFDVEGALIWFGEYSFRK